MPDVPKLDEIANNDKDGSYTVSWSDESASGATGYELQERLGSGSWKKIYDGSGTSKNLSNQDAGNWCYRVRAKNSAGTSGWSSIECTTVEDPLPDVPKLDEIANNDKDGNYTVSWSDESASGATGYELQERLGSGSWKKIYDGSGTSKNLSNQDAGNWCYRVRAKNSAGTSGWSSIECTTVEDPLPDVPKLDEIANNDKDGSYTVSWSDESASGATGYELQERLGSGSWKEIYDGSGTSKNLSNQDAGNWCYRVRAKNSAGTSGWSSIECTTVEDPLPDVPKLDEIANNDKDGSYTVSWSDESASGATGYELQERLGSGSWKEIYDGSGTNKNLSNQAAGQWCYQVRAKNSSGESAWSGSKCTTVDPPPTGEVDFAVSVEKFSPQQPKVIEDKVVVDLIIKNVGSGKYVPDSGVYTIDIKLKNSQTGSYFVYKFKEKDLVTLEPGAAMKKSVSFYVVSVETDRVEIAFRPVDKEIGTGNNGVVITPLVQAPSKDIFTCLSIPTDKALSDVLFYDVPDKSVYEISTDHVVTFDRVNSAINKGDIGRAWDLFTDFQVLTEKKIGDTSPVSGMSEWKIVSETTVDVFNKFVVEPQCDPFVEEYYWIKRNQRANELGIDLNTIHVNSTVYPLITDMSGKKIGFDNKGIPILEIGDGKLVKGPGGQLIVIYPSDGTSLIEIYAYDKNLFDMTVGFNKNNQVTHGIRYRGIPVESVAKGQVDATTDVYLMEIDEDGDGTIDKDVEPDSVEVILNNPLFVPIISRE